MACMPKGIRGVKMRSWRQVAVGVDGLLRTADLGEHMRTGTTREAFGRTVIRSTDSAGGPIQERASPSS